MGRALPIEKIRDFPKRIIIFFSLFFFLLLFSTISYTLIKGVSFFQALILALETLAFMLHSEAGLGKALEIFLAIFGVFLVWWILWSLFDLLLEGNFSKYLKIRKIFNMMRKMKNHYIIAGGGRVGEEIAKSLSERKREFIIIEKDESKISKLKKRGFFAIYGDVTDESMLKEANIKDAQALILAMPETEKNLLVTMTAKEINPNIKIYARADKPAFVSKLKKAGADCVIVPELVAAEKFLEAIK